MQLEMNRKSKILIGERSFGRTFNSSWIKSGNGFLENEWEGQENPEQRTIFGSECKSKISEGTEH